MVTRPTGDFEVDEDLMYICAFSFPAVFSTIGGKNWFKLRDVYHTLIKSQALSTKRTLAYSLHEVAKTLGQTR